MGRTKEDRGAKNKLTFLRMEMNMPIRTVQDLTKIPNTTISMLENEANKRTFRQIHTEVLTELFQVTADYLLGNSQDGIIVYTTDNTKMIISEDEYLRLKNKMKIEFIKYPTNAIIPDDNRKYYALGYVKRTLLDNKVKDIDKRKLLLEKYENFEKRLTTTQLEKVIKFMEDYILPKND